MGTRPDVRVSDRDRERVVTQLRSHYEEGRLRLDELNERLDEAYGARTVADLDAVLRELPEPPAPPPPPPARYGRERRTVLGLAVRWAALNVFAIVIWAATGAESHFWPKWVLLVSSFVTVVRAIKVFWPELEHHRHGLPRPPRPPRL